MRFLLLLTQLTILAASLDAAPVVPSHSRLGRRQTDGSIPQLTPDAITDYVPLQLAQVFGAACSDGTCSADLAQLQGIVQNIVNDIIIALSLVVPPSCDAGGQPASSSAAPPDPSDGGPVNDEPDPSQAQLGDFDSSDNTFGGGGFGFGDGSAADGSGSFGDTGNGPSLQGGSLQGGDGGDDDSVDLGSVVLDDTRDATSAGTSLANDDTTSQSDSSTSGSNDLDNSAVAAEGASSDATNLDSQDGCSGSTCGDSGGLSVDGFPTITVGGAQAPDAGSGSGDDSGLTGTGDSSNNGVRTDNAAGAPGSGGLQSEASDAGVIGNTAFGDFLGDSSKQAGADAATGDLNGSQTGADGDGGSVSGASSPTLDASPPAVDVSLPALASSSSPTGVSSVSSDSSSVGNNDANAQSTDASQSGSSSASGGSPSPPISGLDSSTTDGTSPPLDAPSTASSDSSSAGTNGAVGPNASEVLPLSGSDGSADGTSGTGGTDGTIGAPADTSGVQSISESAPTGDGESNDISGGNSIAQAGVGAPSFGTGDSQTAVAAEGAGPASSPSNSGASPPTTDGVPPPAGPSTPAPDPDSGDGDEDDGGFDFGVQRNGLGGQDSGDATGSGDPSSSPTRTPQPSTSTASCASPTGTPGVHFEAHYSIVDICINGSWNTNNTTTTANP